MMKYHRRLGKGALYVGQLEAQKLFPNGRGSPSFASSREWSDQLDSVDSGTVRYTLNDTGNGETLQ